MRSAGGIIWGLELQHGVNGKGIFLNTLRSAAQIQYMHDISERKIFDAVANSTATLADGQLMLLSLQT